MLRLVRLYCLPSRSGHGYAVLFYDKRRVGESTGKPTDDINESAKVAAAAVEFLKQQPEVDSKRIALYAVSNGAWIAPIVASKTSDVRAVVLVSVAPFSPLEQDFFAYEHTDFIRDGDRALAERASELRSAIHRYLATGKGYDAAKAAYAVIGSDPKLAYMKIGNAATASRTADTR